MLLYFPNRGRHVGHEVDEKMSENIGHQVAPPKAERGKDAA